jgi:hypothetical protein
MGFFTGAAEGLQDALVEQEMRRRQAMLDAINAESRKSQEEDRRSNREIQRENMLSAKAQREQSEADAKQGAADKFENSTAMGTELDDAGAALLEGAGRGSHIKPATIAASPITAGADGSVKILPVVGGKRIFAGTAKQQDEDTQRKARAAYIQSLPPGDERKFYEAQDAVGDRTPSAYVPPHVTKPQSQLEYEYAKSQGYTGSYQQYQNEDANRKAPHDKPVPPQIVYRDGVATSVQYTPGAGWVEVPLPAGVTGKTAPKPAAKTPEQIETERRAAAKGTAEGKAAAAGANGGGFSTLNMIGSMWAAAHPGKPAQPNTGTAAPKVGDTKKFPNGSTGMWDGTGWVKQ